MTSRTHPAHGRDPEVSLSWEQALTWRLGRHRLDDPHDDPVDVVRDLGGVQAQVQSSAAQVVGVRSGSSGEDLERLLWADRGLVKTWAMRGTLHLLPTEDFPTWIAALRTREWPMPPSWERYHGVTRGELEAITTALPEVLADEPVTRDELAARIIDHTGLDHLGDALRSGWAAVLKPAANQGLLVQGPPDGANVTFVEPERWLGLAIDGEADEGLATVLRWFLDAHGPATHEDFGRWFGVTPKAAREVVKRHAAELALVDLAGRPAWMTPEAAAAAAAVGRGASRPPGSKEPAVHLLPGFDPYVLAPISHRDHVIPEGRVGEVSRTAGWISPVLIVDGRVAGTWELERDDDQNRVVLTPFAPLPQSVVDGARRHLETRYARVLGGVPELEIAVPSVV